MYVIGVSAQGRFTSVDPITIAPQRLADPQGLNLYAYVRNNPLSFIDPEGMDLIATGSDDDQKKLEAGLAAKAKELKAGDWNLAHDKNGKVSFVGDAPGRPKDAALARIYDTIVGKDASGKAVADVHLSLSNEASVAIGSTGSDGSHVINVSNAQLLATTGSGVSGTSLSDTFYHETYEAISM